MEGIRGDYQFRGEPANPGTAKPFMPSYRWLGYQTVEEEQVRPEYPPSHAFETTTEPDSASAQLLWRPFYLRRLVIASFIGTFILVLVAIETLLAISNKNGGIATSRHELHYLWTHGPTALLTLVSALWARAEYQSKLVAPWRRLMQQPLDAKRTLLLDYVSGFQVFVVFKALRNKDWTVSIACTVSLLIKILIVTSTGLITLSWTGVHLDSHSMLLQDNFSNNTRLSKTGTLSHYVMQGLIGRNLTYPDGMSKDYAFQSVLTNHDDSTETRVTVDGLTNGLDCVPAEVVVRNTHPADLHYSIGLDLTVKSPGCGIKTLDLNSQAWLGDTADSSYRPFARFARAQCDDTDDYEGSRVLLMFGNMTYSVDNTRSTTDDASHIKRKEVAKLHQSTQLLCVPNYTITRVEVVRNGTETKSVKPVSGATNRTLKSIHPWDIMDAHYSSYINPIETYKSLYGISTNISGIQVDTDQYFDVAIRSQLGPNTTVQAKDMFDPIFLEQIASNYYRQFAAVVAKQSLMEPASIEVLGSATFMANRLVVRTWSAQWMAGLVVSCMILLAIALFTVPRRDEKDLAKALERCNFLAGVVHNPITNRGEFAIIDQELDPDDSRRTFSQTLARRNQHPGVLHPVFRLTMCSLLVGIIIALELMLQKSIREDGLGDAGNDTYLHYLWTTLPALSFGIITMAFSSMDFNVRSLAPFLMLRKRVTTDKFMKLDHLDMSIPRAMYREIMAGNVGAFATTATLVVASLFTIFSGSLFQALAVPSNGLMALRANQSFDLSPINGADQAGSISSLILESNLSYPSFTYRDLAFPQLVLDTSGDSKTTFDLSAVSIEATVPAVRNKLRCRLYNSSKHRFNHTRNYSIDLGYTFYNPLVFLIEGEECGLDPEDEDSMYNSLFNTFPNTTYIGMVGDAPKVGNMVGRCSNLLYTWGKIDYFANPVVQHVASLGCNISFERVDVDTTFIGARLQIDTTPDKAPRPRDDTARNSTIKTAYEYRDLAEIGTDPALLDPFFGTLVSSRFAIPLSDLGNDAADEKVADAIRFQHNLIQAQLLASNLVPANATNATLALGSAVAATDNDARPVYAAKVTDATARRRVVQDEVSTRALEALLGVALALLVTGWLCLRQTAVLPRAPTTPAAVAALVAGGDVLKKLPPDGAAWRAPADLADALRAAGTSALGIGWGRVPDLEGRAAGGENENGARRFGIFAIDEVEEEGEEKDPILAEESDPRKQQWAFHEQITAYDNLGGEGSR